MKDALNGNDGWKAGLSLMAGMGGKLRLRLARLMASSRGDFSQAIRESVLKFRIVGI